MSDDELLTFACPRCEGEVVESYYGPCEPCRLSLRATQGGDQREAERVEFDPKMNVTPNAVALKE